MCGPTSPTWSKVGTSVFEGNVEMRARRSVGVRRPGDLSARAGHVVGGRLGEIPGQYRAPDRRSRGRRPQQGHHHRHLDRSPGPVPDARVARQRQGRPRQGRGRPGNLHGRDLVHLRSGRSQVGDPWRPDRHGPHDRRRYRAWRDRADRQRAGVLPAVVHLLAGQPTQERLPRAQLRRVRPQRLHADRSPTTSTLRRITTRRSKGSTSAIAG